MSQFHQNFTRIYFIQKRIEQLFSSSIWLCNFWHQNIDKKVACKMLMKLTPCLKVLMGIAIGVRDKAMQALKILKKRYCLEKKPHKTGAFCR